MATGRKTGGRIAGTPNKATAEIRGAAQPYTVEALEGLAQIARTSDSDAAKVAAWKAILDRGHGRPAQEVVLGGPDGGPIQVDDLSTTELARRIAFVLAQAAQATSAPEREQTWRRE